MTSRKAVYNHCELENHLLFASHTPQMPLHYCLEDSPCYTEWPGLMYITSISVGSSKWY